MKGHWHLIAISYLAVSLTTSYYLLLFYCLFIIWLYQKRRLLKLQLLFILSTLVIFFIVGDEQSPATSKFESLQSTEITGKIVSSVTNTKNKVEFKMIEDKSNQKTLVTLFKNPNDQYNYTDLNVNLGASCKVFGEREYPPQSKNPGQFDYQKYLKQNGVNFIITINNPENLKCFGSSKLNSVHMLRDKLLSDPVQRLSSFTSGWLRALVLGDDGGISLESEEIFQRWSLSHLLAISGLHVGLIVGIIYFILVKFQLLTKEKAQGLLIILLPIYAILAGGAPSVWRSSLMTVAFLLLIKLKSRLSVTDVISFVFLVFVIYDANILYQLGFQFSFIVTFGLLISRNILAQPYPKWFTIFFISVISQLSILPLQINQFYFFNPMSIFINLLYVPYFSLIVIPLMFFTFLSLYLMPPVAFVLDWIFISIHQPALKLLSIVDHFLYYPLVIGKTEVFYWLIYYLLFYLLMKHIQQKQQNQALKYGGVLIFLLLFLTVKPYLNPYGTVTMLDIGQGDSFIIELPYRKSIIFIDAAGTVSTDFVTPSDKIFKQVIKPYLYSRGILKIDSIVLTHNDHDHVGSVPFIVDQFRVDQLVISRYFQFTDSMASMLAQNNTSIQTVEAGDRIKIDKQTIQVLFPKDDKGATNENSLVLYSEIGGIRWLFTGDINSEIENEMIRTYPEIGIDVLKVAHHGSNTSTSEEFLSHTQPRFAWISVGENNRYGHPNQEVIERLEKYNIVIMRTDEKGAIQYKFKGQGGTFHSFLP
ncbi:DNA internalization-related competence protein ComEC/Rec2 [Aquibacillus saliphilus]|uniref:DNA internalization-related competence protein ComEC/Rec2 n=1 Tax=Aquibacillus saliphilus TaxID=1909422 RepID=UPI001CF082A1